ncbi:MAG: hypothetical protein QOI61_1618 [Actinomycetota bacterium]
MGGAALVAGSGVVVERVGWNKILRQVGLASSPDHHVPKNGAPVRTLRFDSRAMGGATRVAISAPDDARGVIICLHGRNGDYRTAFDEVHVHDVVAAARLPLAVVGVDGGDSSYWHKRASGIDPQALIQDEVMPRVEAELGGPLPRALLGWSMGGYGALLTAERHPEEYRAVVGSSPALWREPSQSAPGAFDNAEDYRRNDVFAGIASLASVSVRIDCGTSDPFLGAARAFASQLPKPNPGAFTDGFHDAPYWRSVAPAQVATIGAALLT